MNRLAAALIPAAFAALAAAGGSGARAQDAGPEVEAAVAAALIEDAAAQLRRARDADEKLAALGKAVTAYESGLAAIRSGIRRLSAQEAALRREAEGRRADTDRLLGLLMAMRLAPAPALLTHPGGPVAHERAGHIMAGIAPGLRARVEELRALLARAEEIRARQTAARDQARAVLAALQKARADAAEAMREKDGAADGAVFVPTPPGATLAAGAATMRDFARTLDAASADLPRPARAADPRYGALRLPVVGRVTRRFGEPDEEGAPSSGVLIEAPGYAQVSAPFDATLRFAGPLEGYGAVAILEPEPGRLLILAGLASIDRPVGAALLEGEPLGALGPPPPSSDEFFVEASARKGAISVQSLYMETREDGDPVDPASWFAFEE